MNNIEIQSLLLETASNLTSDVDILDESFGSAVKSIWEKLKELIKTLIQKIKDLINKISSLTRKTKFPVKRKIIDHKKVFQYLHETTPNLTKLLKLCGKLGKEFYGVDENESAEKKTIIDQICELYENISDQNDEYKSKEDSLYEKFDTLIDENDFNKIKEELNWTLDELNLLLDYFDYWKEDAAYFTGEARVDNIMKHAINWSIQKYNKFYQELCTITFSIDKNEN